MKSIAISLPRVLARWTYFRPWFIFGFVRML